MLIVLVASGLVAASVAPLAVRLAGAWSGWVLSFVPLSMAILVAAAMPEAAAQPFVQSIPWVPSLQLELALRLDGLAAVFSFLVTAIGALVCVYAAGYLHGHRRLGRFLSYLLTFMTAMVGLVLADNLLVLYAFWELTSVTSWLLIGFDHSDSAARKAAWQSFIVTAAGGLSLLAAVVMLGQLAGTYRISDLLGLGDELRNSHLYGPILTLVLAAAATKSALVPIHFWLPNAMSAPTPVSAYLHSAAMVNAGLYLLARLTPALGGTTAWVVSLSGLGAATALVGAWLSFVQTDAKRLLAYTTISTLGMMTLGLGIGGPDAVRAFLVLFAAHALYKGALFMVVGSLDHGAGGRDLGKLGGLLRPMPWTAAGSILAIVSMVGLPPSLGFLGEESLTQAAQKGSPHVLLFASVVVASTLYAASGFVVGLRPLLGSTHAAHKARETTPSIWLPALVTGAAGIGVALSPALFDSLVFGPATMAVAEAVPQEPLQLWHGLTPSLGAKLGILIVAASLALNWPRLQARARRYASIARLGPDRMYDLLDRGLNRVARASDLLLQHGYLSGYLLVISLVVVLAVGSLALSAGVHLPAEVGPTRHYDFALCALMIGGAAGATFFRGRLAVLVSMSVVGYSVATYFAIFSGPDLAITQALSETLLTVLAILLLPRIPRTEWFESRPATFTNALVAIACGTLITALLLTAHGYNPAPGASRYYLAHSAEEGGTNVVNTVLVGFRAIDTMGEVAVLASAALGVLALLRTRWHR